MQLNGSGWSSPERGAEFGIISYDWSNAKTQWAVAPAQVEQDVAFFQLVRGDYAWLGWGVWGMTWPFTAEPAHGQLPPSPHGAPRPALLSRDFGQPEGLCKETSHASG